MSGVSWKDYLTQHAGISDSQAREIYQLTKSIPMFKNLGIPFTEFCNRRNEIKSMLAIRDVKSFWAR